MGGKIREDQRRKENENDFKQSFLANGCFAPFLMVLCPVKQLEGLQLHYYFSSFYNLLDLLKI